MIDEKLHYRLLLFHILLYISGLISMVNLIREQLKYLDNVEITVKIGFLVQLF